MSQRKNRKLPHDGNEKRRSLRSTVLELRSTNPGLIPPFFFFSCCRISLSFDQVVAKLTQVMQLVISADLHLPDSREPVGIEDSGTALVSIGNAT